MSNADVIQRYFKTFFSGRARHSEVRSFLTEDFSIRDPLMSANGADEYVKQLEALGDDMELHATVRELVAAGDVVAALVDFEGPAGVVVYAQWFTMREGKIARLETVYDPRPFLQGGAGG